MLKKPGEQESEEQSSEAIREGLEGDSFSLEQGKVRLLGEETNIAEIYVGDIAEAEKPDYPAGVQPTDGSYQGLEPGKYVLTDEGELGEFKEESPEVSGDVLATIEYEKGGSSSADPLEVTLSEEVEGQEILTYGLTNRHNSTGSEGASPGIDFSDELGGVKYWN